MLSEEQFARLRAELAHVGISNPAILDEFADHIAAELEAKLQAGLPFDQALHQVVAPYKLQQLSGAQAAILDYQSAGLRGMPKLEVAAMAGAMLAFVGALMKSLHLPASNELLIVGLFALAVVLLIAGFRRLQAISSALSWPRRLIHAGMAIWAVSLGLLSILQGGRTTLFLVGAAMLLLGFLLALAQPVTLKLAWRDHRRYIVRGVLLPILALLLYYASIMLVFYFRGKDLSLPPFLASAFELGMAFLNVTVLFASVRALPRVS